MSINDLLDSEAFGTWVIFLCGIVYIFYGLTKMTKTKEKKEKENEVTEHNVKILECICKDHDLYETIKFYKITVELNYGRKLEFSVNENIYKKLSVGDVGTLTYTGDKFISFYKNNR